MLVNTILDLGGPGGGVEVDKPRTLVAVIDMSSTCHWTVRLWRTRSAYNLTKLIGICPRETTFTSRSSGLCIEGPRQTQLTLRDQLCAIVVQIITFWTRIAQLFSGLVVVGSWRAGEALAFPRHVVVGPLSAGEACLKVCTARERVVCPFRTVKAFIHVLLGAVFARRALGACASTGARSCPWLAHSTLLRCRSLLNRQKLPGRTRDTISETFSV
mmetsp:Transcript_10260/g.12021  ORF Transcript_10260/g.12021 Transcript_10260/m.12021 type:complete len:215 (-) Transcript_10260:8-652(-)